MLEPVSVCQGLQKGTEHTIAWLRVAEWPLSLSNTGLGVRGCWFQDALFLASVGQALCEAERQVLESEGQPWAAEKQPGSAGAVYFPLSTLGKPPWANRLKRRLLDSARRCRSSPRKAGGRGTLCLLWSPPPADLHLPVGLVQVPGASAEAEEGRDWRAGTFPHTVGVTVGLRDCPSASSAPGFPNPALRLGEVAGSTCNSEKRSFKSAYCSSS